MPELVGLGLQSMPGWARAAAKPNERLYGSCMWQNVEGMNSESDE